MMENCGKEKICGSKFDQAEKPRAFCVDVRLRSLLVSYQRVVESNHWKFTLRYEPCSDERKIQ